MKKLVILCLSLLLAGCTLSSDKTLDNILNKFENDNIELVKKTSKVNFYKGDKCSLNYIHELNSPIALNISYLDKRDKKTCIKSSKALINKLDENNKKLYDKVVQKNKAKFKYNDTKGYIICDKKSILIVFNDKLYKK
ncbi:MAG: hypothetical protein RR543_00630 [Erysipelotrichales bacterium]